MKKNTLKRRNFIKTAAAVSVSAGLSGGKASARKRKQYKIDNKEKFATRRKIKIICECEAIITKRGLSAHKKTNSHKRRLKALED